MTSRREFLQIGMAATALPLATEVVRAAGVTDAADALPLYRAVYDTRFSDSVAFAAALGRHGVPMHAIDGDVTRLWYDDLYHAWRTRPVAIAGLTAHGALFCLERLAWDHGMRVVFRAEHRYRDGRIEHDLAGPVAMLAEAERLGGSAAWPACMAAALCACPRGRTELGRAHRAAPFEGAAPAGEELYSWVIAPVVRG